MPRRSLKSDREHRKNLTWWIEYDPPTRTPNGSWKVEGEGKLVFRHTEHTEGVHDLRAYVGEFEPKVAYGETPEKAVEGLRRRVNKTLMSVVGFILNDDGDEGRKP